MARRVTDKQLIARVEALKELYPNLGLHWSDGLVRLGKTDSTGSVVFWVSGNLTPTQLQLYLDGIEAGWNLYESVEEEYFEAITFMLDQELLYHS